MITRTAVAFVAAALLYASTAANARGETPASLEKRADTHLQRGIEFYAEKQYELAIVEFRAGYGLDPRADFLFALAQSERLSGDCPTAVVYYERFLQTTPDTNQEKAARLNMKRCTRALESGPGGRPLEATKDALDSAEKAGPPAASPIPLRPTAALNTMPRSDRAPWYRDVIGTSLLAGGVVALGLGTGFWVAKGSAETAASSANNYADYVDNIDRAKRNRAIALVGFGAGAALVAGGVVRYWLRGQASSTAIVGTPASGGGAIVGILGSF